VIKLEERSLEAYQGMIDVDFSDTPPPPLPSTKMLLANRENQISKANLLFEIENEILEV
jgi:hypothetical protein